MFGNLSAARPRGRARVDDRGCSLRAAATATAASALARVRIRIPWLRISRSLTRRARCSTRTRSCRSTRICATSCVSRSAPISTCAIARRRLRPSAISRERFTEGTGDVMGVEISSDGRRGAVRDARPGRRGPRARRRGSAEVEHLGVRDRHGQHCGGSSSPISRRSRATTSRRTICRTAESSSSRRGSKRRRRF